MTQEIDPYIRKLYPDLSPDQQEEMQYSFKRYIELISQIYDRLDAERATKKIDNTHLRKEWEKRNKNTTNH